MAVTGQGGRLLPWVVVLALRGGRVPAGDPSGGGSIFTVPQKHSSN